MTPAAVLIKAMATIRNSANWCKQEMARDIRKRPVPATDPKAVRFSLDGALLRAADMQTPDGKSAYFHAVQHLRGMFRGSIADFNDRSDHSKIIQYLKTAISALEGEGKAA